MACVKALKSRGLGFEFPRNASRCSFGIDLFPRAELHDLQANRKLFGLLLPPLLFG